jgi:hypothetical protein
MGKLICCCQEADDLKCDRCIKNKKCKPDHIVEVPTWRRNLVDIYKMGKSTEK